MRPTKVASALLEMAVSKTSRDSVKDAVKTAIESSRASRRSASHATERARAIVEESRQIRYGATPTEFEDDVAELWFPHLDDEDVRLANDAFFARLPREYDELFRRHDDLPDISESLRELPEEPIDFWSTKIASQAALGLCATKSALADRKVLEFGAQAGELAKRLAPITRSWLGIDHSTAALKVARLVCPENATFIHPAKHVSLAVHHGSVDTIVGRRMFVHKTLEAARELIGFFEPFLVTEGRVFAEFYFPNSDKPREHTYPAVHPPADIPDAVFAYSRANVEAVIRNRPFRIVCDEERPLLERRFVILEKTELDY